MVARFVKHKITTIIDGTSYIYYFLAPPEHYTGIDTAAGVEVVDADSIENDMPVTKVEEILKSPIGTRKKLKVKQTNGKSKYHQVVISSAKSDTFDAAVNDKTYKGGKIDKVVEPLDASFY